MPAMIKKVWLGKTPSWIKIPIIIMLSFLTIIIIAVITVISFSGDSNYHGQLNNPLVNIPTDSHVDAQVKQLVVSQISQYKKGEEQTYLTLPEWYLVYNPKEYAHYLANGNNPSDFPFLQSINEYWRLYDRVTHLTNGVYPENGEYKTTLLVIGISTTAEYIIKGFYESTIGRLSYWTASTSTPEDILIQQAHAAYEKQLYNDPWYAFPFADWLGKVWTKPPFFGPNFIRKIERKFLITMEFGFKAIYAKIIGFSSKTVFDPSDGQIKMHIATINFSAENFKNIDPRITILHGFGGNEWIISIPRWGGFTEIIPKLIDNRVRFFDIAGNDDILLTVITDEGNSTEYKEAQFLFNSIVTSPTGKQRLVYSVKVNRLTDFLSSFNERNLVLEHIYDY